MTSKFNAKVVGITDITPEIKVFKIVKDDGTKFEHKAGQFAVLGLPMDKNNPDGEWVQRAYSISSVSGSDTTEFYIVLVENGKLTTRLFALKEGDPIYMAPKAAGVMGFEDVPDDVNVLFLSTGTGIAPFTSIIRTFKDQLLNGKRKVALFHGARYETDLAYFDEFQGMEKEFEDFGYFPVVSRADEQWHGLTGHVQVIMEKELDRFLHHSPFDPEKTYAFICGNPKMVEETAKMFLDKGFKHHNIKEHGNLRFDKH